MSVAAAGYLMVAVIWVVILTPIVTGMIRFIRTTRPTDLIPRWRIVQRRKA